MSSPTKYPGYNKLPTELKLQVVRAAAAELEDECSRSHMLVGTERPSLAKYACIDPVWQEIIERCTFDSLNIRCDEIENFAKTCRKRHGILRQITLFPYPPTSLNTMLREINSDEGTDINHMNSEFKTSLHALFNTMKDWRPEERRRRGLIEVHINLMSVSFFPVFKNPISVDFSGLPTVNVVDRFFQGYGDFMDASTTMAIYRKLPNLDVVSLNFFWQSTTSKFLTESMGVLDSLRRLPRVPTQCNFFSTQTRNYGRFDNLCQAELPILKCLTSPELRWSDTMTELNLTCTKDVPQLLQQFQMTSWPQLRRLMICGGIDVTHPTKTAEVTGVAIQNFIGALSNIPKASEINIILKPQKDTNRIHFTMNDIYFTADDIYFTMSFAPDIREQSVLPPVTHRNKAFAQFRWVSIPGYLAQKLQDAIRIQHGLELEVFCIPYELIPDTDVYIGDTNADDDDDDHDDEYDPFFPSFALQHRCRQWNSQKSRWDRFTSEHLEPGWRREWKLVDDPEEPDTVNSSQ